ncbi:hypothetical protein SDJN02_09780, partial [Cucurbita argyrosperma subsp. argyrosperma]
RLAKFLTGVRRTPSRSFTNPIVGPDCRFIISAWISGSSIFDKSGGGRSKSLEADFFLPHSFQDSSSSSSTTSSRSSRLNPTSLKMPAVRTIRKKTGRSDEGEKQILMVSF